MKTGKLQICLAVIFDWNWKSQTGLARAFNGAPTKKLLVQAKKFQGSDKGGEALRRNQCHELVGARILFVPPLDGDWDTLAWAFDGPNNRAALEGWVQSEDKRRNPPCLPKLPFAQVVRNLNPRNIFIQPKRPRRKMVAVAC